MNDTSNPAPVRKILGISGSLRERSFNTALLRAAQGMAGPELKIEIYEAIGDLPLFNADLEADGLPDAVADLHAAIDSSDGLLIATPEYNWSTTGVLKNALDWASRGGGASPMHNKPVAIFGAGGRFGTVRAQLHLREILGHNQIRLVANPHVYIESPSVKFDERLELTDERHRDQVSRLLSALAAEIDSA